MLRMDTLAHVYFASLAGDMTTITCLSGDTLQLEGFVAPLERHPRDADMQRSTYDYVPRVFPDSAPDAHTFEASGRSRFSDTSCTSETCVQGREVYFIFFE